MCLLIDDSATELAIDKDIIVFFPLSINVETQELICKGGFLPLNTYDCDSFVVNGTTVVGKEKKSLYNRWKSIQKGADSCEISI